jgi:hypothetical protein
MKKIILIALLLVTANSYALTKGGFYSNNELLNVCEDAYYCDAYFSGFIDGVLSGSFLTTMKKEATISPVTLRNIYKTFMYNHPAFGDIAAPATISSVLKINNYATGK